MISPLTADNPFFQKWETPFGVPPFDRIRPEHYLPAFEAGIRRHQEEIRAIARNPRPPTFRNTIEALEDSGVFLDRVGGVLAALVEADTNAELQRVAQAARRLLSGHEDDLHLNRALFQRVEAVHAGPTEPLSPEGRTLLEKTHARFLRGGAALADPEQARLLGHPTFAHYRRAEHMARTPERALQLLDSILGPALARARQEAAEFQALLDRDEPGARLQAWDWPYYAEQVRNLEAGELRPYFPLEQVREGAFRTANRLFGITFNERRDIPVYHPDVRAFLVADRDGGFLGVYFVDYPTRPGKRGGAWMETFRRQGVLEGRDQRPLVYNVANFPRPSADAPSLLRLDEVRTLFHEFGHALHGLLSRCRYRSLSGVATALDCSELPSQIMENWAVEPEVMALYARHHRTGAPLPEGLAARVRRSHRLNQGFATLEYLASAYLDLAWHDLADPGPVDAQALEDATLARLGLPAPIQPRYRTPCFAHSMAGEYAAGYYGYLWSAVLDADAFEAFRERGDLFDPATARSLRVNIMEKGGSEDPAALFRRFRGRDPELGALLRKRGL